MTWQQFAIGAWMLIMFTLQSFGAIMYKSSHGEIGAHGRWTAGALVVLIMAGSWLLVAAILHSGGFW